MKKVLLKCWPYLFILAVWITFSSPYFLKGLVPFPSTYLVNFFAPWSAYPEFAGPVKNGATPDVITQIYPWKNLAIDILKQGQIPLWNPYSFSGTPLLANYQSAVLSPINLLYFTLPFLDAWSIQILLQPFLAGIFTYWFARSLKLSKQASLISSIAFMFCGFITTWMVYGTLGYAILFLPLALLAIEKFYETSRWFYLTLLSLTIPLSFFSGHFQTSLYYLLFIIAYLLFKTITTKKRLESVLTLVSIGSGILLSMPQLLPSIELYLNSVRSSIFIKTEIIPWGYLPTFIAPDFFGNPVTRNDWFGHYAEWNAYIGLIPLMLGIYSLIKKSSYIKFFGLASLAVLLLAFQTPILDLLIALKIPVLSTSAASRIIVLFSFSFAILSGFGFDNLLSDLKHKKFKPVLILTGIMSLIFITLWILVLSKLFIPDERIAVSFSNLRLPTVILILFLFSVFLNWLINSKKILILSFWIIIFIAAFDVLRFATKWQPFDPKNLVFPEVPVSSFLSKISGYDRVFGNLGAEASVTYRIPSIEGYDPLYIGRYGEFIAASSDGKFHKPERSVVLLSKNAKFRQEVINFLGVKYIAHKISDNNVVWTYPVWEYPVDQFKIVYEDDSYQVFENQKVYERVLIVGTYRVEPSYKNLIKQIFNKNTDLKSVVFLEKDPGIDTDEKAKGGAVIKTYESDEIVIEADSSGNALLVLSDPFYSGWKAYIDNKETEVLRANYAFRAVPISPGRHIVRFKYDPDSFRIGALLSVGGLIGIIGQAVYLRRK